MKKLEEYVRSIPDFPEKGIIFRDVTSVLQDADGLHLAIDTMQEKLMEFAGDATLMYYMMDEAQEGKNAFLEKRDPDFDKFPQFPG